MQNLQQYLPIILPILVLQLILMVAALVDLFKPERRVLGDRKPVWVLIIFFVNLVGPLAYFLVGRKEV